VSYPFDPSRGLIVVRAELAGPRGSGILQLALDTGATTTVVNVEVLAALGYDPASEFAPYVELQQLTALGRVRAPFPVLAHTLPPTAGVDGLLGLERRAASDRLARYADPMRPLERFAEPRPKGAVHTTRCSPLADNKSLRVQSGA